jgi:DNA mismatch endonuclease (patch repair protein)
MDRISRERRTANMSAIRAKNTAPELVVRKFLFRSGLRFRLHAKDLPGKPDLVFPARRVAVFVHGCFWHGCTQCIDGARKVKSNRKYWSEKVSGNRERDSRNEAALRSSGWVPLVIWECEVRTLSKLQALFDSIQSVEMWNARKR